MADQTTNPMRQASTELPRNSSIGPGLTRKPSLNGPRNSIDNPLVIIAEDGLPRRSSLTGANAKADAIPEAPEDDGFEYSLGLTTAEARSLLEKHGKNELPEKIIPKWYIFLSQLWQPMPIMIWLAAIVEAAIQNWLDMGILLMIQFTNASIGYYEITKAGDAVAALKKSLKPSATVKRDGKYAVIDAIFVVPGDLVLLGSGSAIPADCRVNEGEIEVDEAALTGESLPVTKFQGSSCKMGSTVVRGEVEGTVEFTGANTFFGKTAALLAVRYHSSCDPFFKPFF